MKNPLKLRSDARTLSVQPRKELVSDKLGLEGLGKEWMPLKPLWMPLKPLLPLKQAFAAP